MEFLYISEIVFHINDIDFFIIMYLHSYVFFASILLFIFHL